MNMALVANQKCMYLIFIFLTLQLVNAKSEEGAKQVQDIEVRKTENKVFIYGGNLTLVIDRQPWRLSVYDNFTRKLHIQEGPEETQRLGYGFWEGKYLNIYEGYLFRIGRIVEWYSARNVDLHNVTRNQTGFIVAATMAVSSNSTENDAPNLLVTFGEFYERQFTMTVALSKPGKYNRVGWGYSTPDPKEGFYGFGERFNSANQRGHVVSSWTEDGNWGLGKWDPTGKLRVPKGELSTYFPMPLYLSTRGYGMQLNMFHRSVFDSKTSNNHMHIMTETNAMNLTFYCRTDHLQTFNLMSTRNGKSLIPPMWTFGPWNQLGDEISGLSIVDRAKQMLFSQDIPLSHCVNTVHYFPEGGGRTAMEKEKLKAQNDELLSLGIKSTAYFNAMVSQKWTSAYNEGASKGFFFTTKKGLPYNYTYTGASDFKVSQLDFTNPNAVVWYQDQLQLAIDTGFKGWMYDYGEYTPPDSISHDGHDGLYMHNLFPLQYQQTCYDYLVDKYGNRSSDYAPDFVYYVRSGYLGSQRVTWAHWTGDPSADWNKASGLPAQITASLNIGISGMPFSGSDIGGFEWYTGPPPSIELWVRWTQLGCFSGLMHEQGGGKGIGNKSHIFDTAEGTRIWRKFSKLRMQLALYTYNTAHTSHKNGLPIMRHHLLSFPRDPQAISQEYQYMFGGSILAAPVVEEGATKWSVYLPVIEDLGNNWIDFSSSSKYDEKDGRWRIGFTEYLQGGTTVEIDVPLDVSPTFIRAGDAIVALDPRIQTLSSSSNPNVTSFEDLGHIRHIWTWPMKWNDFIATGQLYDGSLYQLYFGKIPNVICEFLAFHTPKNITHVVQIAAPWISEPTGVEIGYTSNQLKKAASVEELIARIDDPTIAEWVFDKEMNTIWVKMTPSIYDIMVLGY